MGDGDSTSSSFAVGQLVRVGLWQRIKFLLSGEMYVELKYDATHEGAASVSISNVQLELK
ncbi:hypothetical protein [Ralstonia phage RP13]|nr:hypothetical protein [Ralstonia phage RP13]